MNELQQRGLDPAGAGVAGREGGAGLASELTALPEVAGVVEPLLQLARHAAPVGRAQDQRVALQQLRGVGLVNASLDQLGARSVAYALRDAGGELLGEAAAGVVEQEHAHHWKLALRTYEAGRLGEA